MLNVTFRMAWRNLWRHSRRTWLTTGAMVFSNILLVFAVGLQYGMYQMMIDNSLRMSTGHLQVQAIDYLDQPRIYRSIENATELANQLGGLDGVEAVGVRAESFVLASSEERSYGIQIMGVDPAQEPLISSIPGQIARGAYLTSDDGEIVLGSTLARNLKIDLGDELTLLGTGKDGSFAADVLRVSGIFETGMAEIDRQLAQISLENFQSIFAMGDDGHRIVIWATDLVELDQLYPQVLSTIAERPDLVVHDWNDIQPGLKQMIQADMVSAWMMYAVLVVLVAFGVLNTQLMSVMERTHEFGVMLALGVRSGRLARLIVLETALMSALGLLGGVILGGVLIWWLSIVGFSYPGLEEMSARFNLPGRMYPEVSFASLTTGPAVVFVMSMLAAIYPAHRLNRLQPVEAMRAIG